MLEVFKNFFNKNKNNYSNLIKDFSKNLKFSPKANFDKKTQYCIFEIFLESLDPQKDTKTSFTIYENIAKNYDKLLFQSSEIQLDLFVINPLYIGREYNKTMSFQNVTSDEICKKTLFEVVFGNGYILIQDMENIEEKIDIIKIKEKEIILVESSKCFTIINSSENENLILASFREKDTILKPNVLKNYHGNLLYYTKLGFIKNNNAHPGFVLNEYDENYTLDLAFDKNKGLYKEFVSLPEKFNFLKE